MSLHSPSAINILDALSKTSVSVALPKQEIDPSIAANFSALVHGPTSDPHLASAKIESTPSIYSAYPVNNTAADAHSDSSAPLKKAKTAIPLPSLLGIINSTSVEYQTNTNGIKQNISAISNSEKGEFNTVFLQEIQVNMQKIAVGVGVVSKIAGSITNAINTLVKTQ